MVSEAECPRAWARSQPKCELHRHLEGAIRGADLLAALRDLKDSTVEGDVTAEKLVTRLAVLEPLKVRRRARVLYQGRARRVPVRLRLCGAPAWPTLAQPQPQHSS